MAIPKKTLAVLRERDTHCWHCGTESDLVPHHRINRGMGGSKKLDTLDNLMLVCAVYNGAMESDHATASLARSWGHKLSTWQTTDQAVYDVVTGWWELLPNGEKVSVDVGYF